MNNGKYLTASLWRAAEERHACVPASSSRAVWARCGRLGPLLAVFLILGTGCGDGGTGSPGGPAKGLADLFAPAAPADEWTILCLRSEEPDHLARIARLAEMLRQVQGLKPELVRVESDEKGSNLYYGRYLKTASPQTGRLVFPPQYQRDFSLIQGLTLQGVPVFRYAKPELIEARRPPSETAGDIAAWEVSNARGAYTLQVGVFYATPTFNQHREAAEQYVRLLREEGIPAYYRHDPVRSYVYVGDFEESDIIRTGQGPRFGPRIEQLIARREEEFRYMLENLHIVKRSGPGGQMVVPPSVLVPARQVVRRP